MAEKRHRSAVEADAAGVQDVRAAGVEHVGESEAEDRPPAQSEGRRGRPKPDGPGARRDLTLDLPGRAERGQCDAVGVTALGVAPRDAKRQRPVAARGGEGQRNVRGEPPPEGGSLGAAGPAGVRAGPDHAMLPVSPPSVTPTLAPAVSCFTWP